jgi:hypothetical protein
VPLRLQVDVERLAADYLRGRTEISAIVGTRVSNALPKTPTYPYLIGSRFGGVADHLAWLDRARLQFEAWGTSKGNANLLARTALAALHEMPLATHALGVVTNVAQELGLTWSPDETTDQPRYVFGVAVYLHPPVQ